MIRKSITSIDFNGVERTEDCYFNINSSELMKMDAFSDGGLLEELKEIVQVKDTRKVMTFFERLIEQSYGVKSPDGRTLLKTPETWLQFKNSPAYDALFMDLMTNAEHASEFIENVLPNENGKMIIPENNTQQVLEDFVNKNKDLIGGGQNGQVVPMPQA